MAQFRRVQKDRSFLSIPPGLPNICVKAASLTSFRTFTSRATGSDIPF
jgi:hypothetical protein